MADQLYPPTHPQSLKTVNLLIVDDDDIDVTALKRTLQKLKLLNPLYRAKDGIEALDLLRNGEVPSPYIVLLDINMPRMNGLEFLEHLRADPALTHAIVFVLTTSKSDEDIIAAYREHVAGYLLKQRMDSDFMQVVGLLDHYWRVIELPSPHP
ncbi:response regulator [Cellvibrio japonicus]|uniref:Two-component response regulator n=1 Tax=Cellvibrio japonicus (strain Ueda107) TaxID=498211 RepID=B3PL45_CELJU|nr:response regulator [Cellvibrio japonicus]ACE83261.1 two-component response regulator [Cellvibrio japonicus Ueda107]QEI12933.1 response regulator [Cellvibrio japonicus]QEI16507.1 response regulator [Cellvibrio japonicus]QEI20085.1 response regulator [Cellvibrio japonicus]